MAAVSILISIISIFLFFVFSSVTGVLLVPLYLLFVILLSGCFFASVFESPKYGSVIVSLILSGIMLFIYAFCVIFFTNMFVTLLAPTYKAYSNIIVILVILIILLFSYVRAKKHKLFIQRIPRDKQQTVYSSSLSAPDELAKWKKLYDEGTITEEMFNRKRDELLRR